MTVRPEVARRALEDAIIRANEPRLPAGKRAQRLADVDELRRRVEALES